jgi:hypothetical protein
MKKLLFLTAILSLVGLNWNCYGQQTYPDKIISITNNLNQDISVAIKYKKTAVQRSASEIIINVQATATKNVTISNLYEITQITANQNNTEIDSKYSGLFNARNNPNKIAYTIRQGAIE